MGMLFGLVMGLFITYLKVQPFIATLAGMWLARGLSYVISDAEVRIHDATYTTLGQTKILIPGLADPCHQDAATTSPTSVVVALVVLAFGLFLAHFTRFGRTVYAMGGGNGANEQSARLMGLPVNRTKVLVYVFSGFCSALAGILYSIYVMSGRGNAGTGFELTAIAAVVIGGIALTGGEGYLIGALVGVLITSLIQSIIQANGRAQQLLGLHLHRGADARLHRRPGHRRRLERGGHRTGSLRRSRKTEAARGLVPPQGLPERGRGDGRGPRWRR